MNTAELAIDTRDRLLGMGLGAEAYQLVRGKAYRFAMGRKRFAAASQASPWQPYIGKVGAKKGMKGWKNAKTGRVVWGGTAPKPRAAPAQPAEPKAAPKGAPKKAAAPKEATKKAAPAPKKAAAFTPESAAEAMHAFKRKPGVKQAAALIAGIASMSGKDIAALKKAVGHTASGTKAKMAERLVEKFFEKGAPKKAAAAKKAPASYGGASTAKGADPAGHKKGRSTDSNARKTDKDEAGAVQARRDELAGREEKKNAPGPTEKKAPAVKGKKEFQKLKSQAHAAIDRVRRGKVSPRDAQAQVLDVMKGIPEGHHAEFLQEAGIVKGPMKDASPEDISRAVGLWIDSQTQGKGMKR